MLATIVMKVITEKFLVSQGMGVNREWRFDQKQCRKSVDQGTEEGRCRSK